MQEIFKVWILRLMSMVVSKTDRVKTYLRQGNIKDALAVAKTFRTGFTVKEKRTIDIASEVLSGGGKFYRQLGINVNEEVRNAEFILRYKYKVSKS